jgi:hypothetical protein
MSWNYMESRCEGLYQAPCEAVIEAAEWFFTQSIRWQVTVTQEGFEARGRFGFEMWFGDAIAYFRVRSEPAGTRVVIDLQVERGRGGSGEFDPFGYYDFLVFKWLHQIEALLISGLKPGHGTGTLIVSSEYASRNRVLDSISEAIGPDPAPFVPNR